MVSLMNANRVFLVCKKVSNRIARRSGFTLIELLVVLAIIAMLLSVAMPRYFHSIDLAKESTLTENLRATREILDKYYGDTGQYPESLQQLVEKNYLRVLPVDPITESAQSWTIVPPPNGMKGKVFNIHSGAAGTNRAGKPWAEL
jgi:general secretion pathway protein G